VKSEQKNDILGAMSSESVQVRATESAPQPEPLSREQKDYQFLLEENLELLRETEKHSREVAKYERELSKLKEQLAVQNAKLAKPKAFSQLRKFVMFLHVALSIGAGAFGPILWLNHLAPADACWSIVGGVLWLAIASAFISAMADEEGR
jgi:hypothetical protein